VKGRAGRPEYPEPQQTESIKTLTREFLDQQWREIGPYPRGVKRPKTRGDCVDAPRPCPFLSCRHHIAYEVSAVGSITHRFPGLELEDLPETCSLDVADDGVDKTLEEIGLVMNLTRERVRQIEEEAIETLQLHRRMRLFYDQQTKR